MMLALRTAHQRLLVLMLLFLFAGAGCAASGRSSSSVQAVPLAVAGTFANRVAIEFQSTASVFRVTADSNPAVVAVMRPSSEVAAPGAQSHTRQSGAASAVGAGTVLYAAINNPRALPGQSTNAYPTSASSAATRPMGVVDKARGARDVNAQRGRLTISTSQPAAISEQAHATQQTTAESAATTRQSAGGLGRSMTSAAPVGSTRVEQPRQGISAAQRPTESIKLLFPSMVVRSSAEPGRAVPGALVTYTVGIQNTGPLDVEEIDLADALAPEVAMVQVVGAEIVHFSQDRNVLLARVPGRIKAGAGRSIQIIVQVRRDACLQARR